MSVSSLELLSTVTGPTACPASDSDSSPQVEHLNSEQVLITKRSGRCSICLAELGRAWLEQFHTAPELLFSTTRLWLKQGSDRRAALVEADLDGQSVNWFLKETITRSWWVRFVVQISEFRSSNAWKQAREFRAISVSTPRPLALATFTRNGSYHEYFLTEAISNAITLNQWLGQCRPTNVDFESVSQRHWIARELAGQLRRLHQHRLDHRDLKASNILLSEADGRLKLWLIDLDGVWRWPILPRSRRVQNLARLWAGVAQSNSVTATDALRFLKVYLGADWQRSWKTFWRQITRRAASKIRSLAPGLTSL
ncbi:MAG: Mn2+-dependent serine/threonine protein kinase [Planctomycetaceae bacterium]|nr:Mn2+-dependent serine/threonine protein kinase [Planctomycetaceae bacterium]